MHGKTSDIFHDSERIFNGVPQGFARLVRDRVDAPWLTVIPAPPPPEPAEPAAEPAAPAAE